MIPFFLAQTETTPAPEVVTRSAWLPVLLLALLGIVLSLVAGFLVRRQLQQRKFDQFFVTPWKPLFPRENEQHWPVSKILAWLLTLSGIGGTLAILLQQLQPQLVNLEQIFRIVGHAWLLIFTTLIALAIARLIAAAVISIFDNKTIRNQLELMCPHEISPTALISPPQSSTSSLSQEKFPPSVNRTTTGPSPADWPAAETSPSAAQMSELLDDAEPEQPKPRPVMRKMPPSRLTESFADTMARLTGMLIYLIVFLPVFMIAAEIWGWSATGSSLAEIWQWLLPFAGLTATVLVCWFALTALVISFCPPQQRRNVMIVTTVLALILLTASYNMVFAIITSLILLALLWLTRQDLPDAAAGLYLQMQNQPTVKTIDGPARVLRTQLLTSDLNTVNGNYRVRNRYVLRSFLDGQLIEELRMIKIDLNPG